MSQQSDRLDGKTAVVTGSSSGVGKAIASELAAAGAHVMIHARANQVGAEETADGIRQAGCETTIHLCDLSQPEACRTLVEAAWSWRGGVDIWINNAGVDVLTGSAAGSTFDEKLERLWQVDVRATIELSRRIGALMKQDTGASEPAVILNVGWDQAEHGMEGDSGEMFAAAKGAVMCFTRSLAQSLAPQVRVNCVAPGWIRTAWGEQATSYWQERAQMQSLMQRWGTPEDVARVVRFLVSPAAAFMTGQVVPVNGGFRSGG